MITVTEADSVDQDLLEAFSRLLPQLSRSAAMPTRAELEQMVEAPGTHLLVARAESAIVGSLTLVMFRIPTGLRAWVEDVVVDETARGQGVGEALVRHALDLAAAAGARTVDLTSRASRESANRLYLRVGFRRRDTTVYRWSAADQDSNRDLRGNL